MQAKSRDPKADPKALLAKSEAKVQSLRTYQVEMSRMERVGGRILPEEEIVLVNPARSQGGSAGMGKWSQQGARGHLLECSQPRNDFRAHAVGGDLVAGDEDSGRQPLVMRNSRHAISEAGLDTIVENLRKSERGDDATPEHRAGSA